VAGGIRGVELGGGASLRVPARDDMVRTVKLGSNQQWDFKRGASVYGFMTIMAQAAIVRGIAPAYAGHYDGGEVININVSAQRLAFPSTPVRFRSIEEYIDWSEELTRSYYQVTGRFLWQSTRFPSFSLLDQSDQEAWTFWMRHHPGMLRLELALRSFFSHGGEEAWIALSVERESLSHQRQEWLQDAFNDADLHQVAAPGLDGIWQEAIGTYARKKDLTAIQEPPRFATSEPPEGRAVDPVTRWMGEKSGYEGYLTAMPEPVGDVAPWFSVENPLAIGSYDAVRLSPPAGRLAME